MAAIELLIYPGRLIQELEERMDSSNEVSSPESDSEHKADESSTEGSSSMLVDFHEFLSTMKGNLPGPVGILAYPVRLFQIREIEETMDRFGEESSSGSDSEHKTDEYSTEETSVIGLLADPAR